MGDIRALLSLVGGARESDDNANERKGIGMIGK